MKLGVGGGGHTVQSTMALWGNGTFLGEEASPTSMVAGTRPLEGEEGPLRSRRGSCVPGPVLPPQHKVSRGGWTHCIEDIGVVRNRQLWPGVDMMVKGLHHLISHHGRPK